MATPVEKLGVLEEEKKECVVVGNEKERNEVVGVLEVFVHQARDIHNICIYHKQDVYARLSFTTDPTNSVSTKTINGGGRNPVFNDMVRLDVRSIDTTLKCEIWMLSRVKNYLEDQLLGFALIPLTEVVAVDNKLEKEFSLSSTDLFHSPAGFVQLSLSYNGASPQVMVIPAIETTVGVEDSDLTKSSHPSDLDMIEFPDPKIANEDQIMVSEYFGIPCSNLDSESSESLPVSEGENHHVISSVESFSISKDKSSEDTKKDSPRSEVQKGAVSSPQSPSEAPVDSKCKTQEVSARNGTSEKEEKNGEANDCCSDTIRKPLVSVSIEAEEKVVQQDIVEMYMKSMQQFTESLAKMKLPLDIDTNGGSPSPATSSSDPNLQSPKNSGPRVFYGSRAFF
ncbi:uncharacterized protein LOC101220782 [Cucumis sativus]|uniref:C2 domain-containing protein n=1 Tax=Cucumis sativus TaxID=3659 RepID=A0A0A0L7H6_CUCSA|nr:uncharacterized protein LOC101220782 [Cucumis sativus]XP_004149579.1 uncharacterized protein LOC101220782 [Cucumis sativus]KGN56056.1 hypothetical protein Csa_010562 [Cucumis sativus]